MLGWILPILQTVMSVVLIRLLIMLNVLPTNYLILLIAFLTMLAVFTFLTQISGKYAKAGRVFAIMTASVLIIGCFQLFRIERMFSKISNADMKIETEINANIVTDTVTETEAEHKLEEVTSSNDSVNKILTNDTFIVYISGIDTNGSLSETSRSDLNIIASVNTNTKQILLTTTPRDYYVILPVSGGQMDKLTHAGIYGVDVSMETLENLYDISIDYYVRVNFRMLVDLVDAVGGITVNSEYAFNSGKYSFSKGDNQLSGREALVFVSERYAFTNGDIQRGENQMQVIKSLIDKVSSISIIKNAGEIIDAISENFETNMTGDEIASLLKMQMNDGASWDIVMNKVKGTDDLRTTYSAGNQELYVMIPDQQSVCEAKEMMQKILDANDNRQSIHNFDIENE